MLMMKQINAFSELHFLWFYICITHVKQTSKSGDNKLITKFHTPSANFRMQGAKHWQQQKE